MQYGHHQWLTSTSVFACGISCQTNISFVYMFFNLTFKALDSDLQWGATIDCWAVAALQNLACLQQHEAEVLVGNGSGYSETHQAGARTWSDICKWVSSFKWFSLCSHGLAGRYLGGNVYIWPKNTAQKAKTYFTFAWKEEMGRS